MAMFLQVSGFELFCKDEIAMKFALFLSLLIGFSTSASAEAVPESSGSFVEKLTQWREERRAKDKEETFSTLKEAVALKYGPETAQLLTEYRLSWGRSLAASFGQVPTLSYTATGRTSEGELLRCEIIISVNPQGSADCMIYPAAP